MQIDISNGTMPTRGSPGAAGYDLYSPVDGEYTVGIHMIPLGFKLRIPIGYYVQLKSRSSLALKGMQVIAGVIDEDYHKEIILAFECSKPMTIQKGQRIAQMIVRRYAAPVLVEAKIQDTERGGFGSTGK